MANNGMLDLILGVTLSDEQGEAQGMKTLIDQLKTIKDYLKDINDNSDITITRRDIFEHEDRYGDDNTNNGFDLTINYSLHCGTDTFYQQTIRFKILPERFYTHLFWTGVLREAFANCG